MTGKQAKRKALELCKSMIGKTSRSCALIATSELIKSTTNCPECGGGVFNRDDWIKIKDEIKKL